jgi:3-deoxy-D-manno-octulosonic-acid transferase
MTPTGTDYIKKVFGDSVFHAYLPYDLPIAVANFLRVMQPVLGMIMETELWPNLLAACYKQRVPVCLLNARLSEKSVKSYQRIPSITNNMLQKIHAIAANDQLNADRFIALGATKNQVAITGNIKFDLELPCNLASTINTWRNTLGKNRFIWIAASTHEGEEEIVLAAHKKLRKQDPQALLILVPRHPERFATIAMVCAQSFTMQCHSEQSGCRPDTAVYLGDTMGQLLLLYGVADVAFVGGSLVPKGGHNMLEPAALNKPILTGPHVFNFTEISNLLLANTALTIVTNATSLASQLTTLKQKPHERIAMGEKAQQVVKHNRGALAKQLMIIESVIASIH